MIFGMKHKHCFDKIVHQDIKIKRKPIAHKEDFLTYSGYYIRQCRCGEKLQTHFWNEPVGSLFKCTEYKLRWDLLINDGQIYQKVEEDK